MSLADAGGPLGLATNLAMGLIGVAMVLALVRLVRGPSTPDRVVALDLFSLLAVGAIAIHVIATREVAYLAAALVLALLSFLGTVSFARYLEKEQHR